MASETVTRWALGLDVAYATEDSDAVLAAWRSVTDTAPAELQSGAEPGVLPHTPDVPEELRGRRCFVIAGTYTGALQDGYAVVRPLRKAAKPLLDRTAPIDLVA